MPSSIVAWIAAMCGISTNPNSPTKYAFLPLVERVGRADRLHEVVVLAKRVMVRRDDIDVWIVERLGGNAVQRFAVDHQMIRVELLDVGRDFARPLGRGVRSRCRFPSRESPGSSR